MDKVLAGNMRTTFKLFGERAIKPSDLTAFSLRKAEENPQNAFITVCKEQAQDEALKSDERYKLGQPLSELDGMPIAIKDNFCTKNIRTTCASKMLENFTPAYNATVYKRLLEKGAILIGKTNLDQFAMGAGSVDSIYGSTRNIWGAKDKFYIAGGSSGGSAVAVASKTVFGSLGSDTGGSTRNPASYCGVVGLKPTYGLVSRSGLIPLVNSMDVPGILTRKIDDAVSILNAIAGYDPRDSTSFQSKFKKIRLPPSNKLSIKNLKVGIPIEYHTEFLQDEVLQTWQEIAKVLQENGATIKQISMPNTEYSIVCYSILNQCEVASNMARFDGIEYGFRAQENKSTEKLFSSSRSQGFNEVVRNRILTGNYFLLSNNYEKYFNKALKVRRLIMQDFDKAWDEVQVLLTPTTLSTAPLLEEFNEKTNRDQCAVQDFCTQPANMAGIPAVSLPIKLSKNGLPISLQLMGRSHSEPMLLALAKYLENLVQFP